MTIIKPLTFNDLRFANVQRNKEWDPDNKIPGLFRSTEYAGESGEVCNKIKKLERERLGLKGSRTTIWEVGMEMADAQICLDLLGMHYCIDIAAAVRLSFNAKSEEMGFLTRIY